MLQAQVNYWTLIENQRHNLATEEQARNELKEQSRHNVAQETVGFFNYAETAKHNRATEAQAQRELSLGYSNLSENIRSHKASESINRANANTNRLNAITQATKVGYDNINTQFANRTNRMNAYNNEANTIVRRQELILANKRYNLDVAKLPSSYLPNMSIGIKR